MVVQALNIKSTGIYVDGTFGEGGHSRLILSKLNKTGRLLAIDRDWQAVKIGSTLAAQYSNFTIIHSAFSNMYKCIDNMGLVGRVDGILLDLGLCISQLNDRSRGFSFMQDGPLDMRMDISSGRTASEWLSKASQEEIGWVLRTFGEERFYKRIAKAIVKQRKLNSILSSCVLSRLIQKVVPYYNFRKHPATKSFLAIRIYINQELEEITKVLNNVLKMLSNHGRLVVISFNSLEDRIVKYFIRQNSNFSISLPIKLPLTEIEILKTRQNKYQLKNLGKIKPSKEEIQNNIHARSAILRYAEKCCCTINND